MKKAWIPGRQGTGYFKKQLAQTNLFDLYLIKLPEGSYVPPHVDKIPGKKHYRVNFYLPPKMGGYFAISDTIVDLLDGVFTIFRSDENTHSVSRVIEGTGYILSLGFVTKEDDYEGTETKMAGPLAYA